MDTPLGQRTIHRLDALSSIADINRLPYSIKVLLEACLRNMDGYTITDQHVKAIADYNAKQVGQTEIPFKPGRVVLQDFTGVPAVVDLAAMRDGIVQMTGNKNDAARVNPLVPCDLVIDHSVQVDAFASPDALTINSRMEFERNKERYQFLKWGQHAFRNFRVVPPATGIIHQVNLEYLAAVVWDGKEPSDGSPVLYPDSLVGTDSHTTMINGLGVVGWGVGGIEAEAVMLGQPIYMLLPEVIGFKLTGRLSEGCTATDLVLRITEMLRRKGVVGKFVEYHGPGLADMPLADRATIANMAPEYGATMGFFPVDQQTLTYLELTGRDRKSIDTVEQYCREQGLWRNDSYEITYTDVIELDLSTVEPSLAGPKRPQDRITLSQMKTRWRHDLAETFNKPGLDDGITVTDEQNETYQLQHGAVTIAAITSCTNTSNPDVMIAAGLVAKKAAALGLKRKPWVKTSLAPGSKVVTEYLELAELTGALESLGFHNVGYGCTTCIGNSGPLPDPVVNAIHSGDLVVASVLSGNRNFEGRVNPHVKANYLASPPLVVAYALAGTVDIDLRNDPIGCNTEGKPVFLDDIWPSRNEVEQAVRKNVTHKQFTEQYADVFAGSDAWQAIEITGGELYDWNENSTYIQNPPFFRNLNPEVAPITPITGARCIGKFGDSITTDHISPAGPIKVDSPAGEYLRNHGVPVSMFNSYGSRRGNDRVMTRGTFANIRVRNLLAPGTEGGYTTYLGHGEQHGRVLTIYDAAMLYQDAGIPLVVLAGIDYGMGSSRDWAAKGTYLLGIKAVIAQSFERIHRSNLIGMGVLPLQFISGRSYESLELNGREIFDIPVNDDVKPQQELQIKATDPDNGTVKPFNVICRIDTPVEIEYYRNGGILHTVLRKMAEK